MQKLLKYGIAYYKKECKVVLKNENRPIRGGFRFLGGMPGSAPMN